ncbi:DUF805 domain-containing protein [Streptomyces sp. DT2A-34]|uniref:DUF805 domain-containing protein n=1 Tax=Streptomyces sp. DT2A-34 TaxID=3051182 RepID=UPI00265C298D|nr:DUF805 domain-containing protein [Streptomyces sp. DT2A-34]MDO0912719.1 DUF805 domain-containing protein [Streptomyces sp. DT2A-34]
MSWFIEALKKYAVFSGRARRKEYWMYMLFNSILYIVFAGVGFAIDFPALAGIFAVATLLPSLGVTIRRLHDTGRTGWWILISVIPLVGFIVMLVFTCSDGQAGENQYGPNPKEVPAFA